MVCFGSKYDDATSGAFAATHPEVMQKIGYLCHNYFEFVVSVRLFFQQLSREEPVSISKICPRMVCLYLLVSKYSQWFLMMCTIFPLQRQDK